MFISIKTHIILLLIVVMLIPFVLLRIVVYPRIQDDLQTTIMDNLEAIGHKQAELVSTWMHERKKDAIVVARNPYMIKSTRITQKDEDYKDIVRYLEMIVLEYGYKDAFVSNDKGLVTLATSEDRVGEDISETNYFKQAINGKTFTTNIIPSKVPLTNEFDEKEVGLPTMFVATPLKDKDDAIIGVVTLRIHVGTLSNLMQSYKVGETGETYLTSKEGVMLTESRFSKHLKKRGMFKERSALELKLVDPETGELTTGVKQCVAGYNGSDAKGYNDYGGISVLGVWSWVPEFNWGIITEIDRSEAYGTAYNLKYIVTALLLVMVFPIVLVAYILGGRLTRPILELAEVTEKMVSGDLTQRVNIKSNNEIGILATSFNTMAKTLDAKTTETVESEKRYRELFDSLKVGIYQCEPGVEGAFTWVNKAGAEIFGYESPEEMIGTKVNEIYVDTDDRKRLVEKLEKEGVWRDFVSSCKKKNGEHFYTERTSNMVRNAEGKPLRIDGSFKDVSLTKKPQLQLLKSEKKYRVLFDSLKEGVYRCEPGVEGVFTWVNQSGAEIFGYKSPEDMIGVKVNEIYVDTDDRRRLVEKLEKEEVWSGVISFCKKKNGECFYTEHTSYMIKDEKGIPIHIEGICKDITGRMRFEEELQESKKHQMQLLNLLKEGVFQCEPGEMGMFTWVNHAGMNMLGLNSPEEVLSTRVVDIYENPDDRKNLIEKLEKEGTCRDITSHLKRKNGDRFTSETTCNLIYDKNDKPIRIEGVFRDVTGI
jgi:PAS domain S-box-containing protein